MFSNKRATSLEADAMVASPAHVVLFSVCTTFCCFHIAHGHTIVFFVQVRIAVENATDNRGVPSRDDIEEISGDRSVLDMYDYAILNSMSN